MRDVERERIRDIKARIGTMLQERHALANSGSKDVETDLVQPSSYWSDFCASFDYMLGLPEEAFEKLRLHTYHLTADGYLTYYFGDPKTFPQTANLDGVTAGLPDRYILNEPTGGIGFRWDNRFVSWDTVRFQQVVTRLYRNGVLGALERLPRRRILEIGGGYGGLAHHLTEILGPTTYVIIDLPETLIFSASYLTLLHPEKKLYVYDEKTCDQVLRDDKMGGYDFIFLPNYALARLGHLEFDFVLNTDSLQEMRQKQVEEYLDFVRRRSKLFYSKNVDRQPRNRELTSLSDLLASRFTLTELKDQPDLKTQLKRELRSRLEGVARKVLRRPGPPAQPPSREYLCRPL